MRLAAANRIGIPSPSRLLLGLLSPTHADAPERRELLTTVDVIARLDVGDRQIDGPQDQREPLEPLLVHTGRSVRAHGAEDETEPAPLFGPLTLR